MTQAEVWALTLASVVGGGLLLYGAITLWLSRGSRVDRVRSAVDVFDRYSQTVNRINRMPAGSPQRQTADRVLEAAQSEMDQMVPPPPHHEPNLDNWY